MGAENGRTATPMGFSGLPDLVSDGAVELTRLKGNRDGKRPSGPKREETKRKERSQEPQQETTPNQYPQGAPKPTRSWAGWIWGFIVVVIVVQLATNSDDSPQAPEQGADLFSDLPADATRRPTPEPPLDKWLESKPPVGTNAVLTMNQIRYCLAEDVRIDAAGPLVDDYSQSDIERFNAMVNNYNSRCASFRYRSGSLEAVQREVARARPRLEQEGRSRFAPSGAGISNSPNSFPEPNGPQPNKTVKDIQLQLLALGYDPGIADGLLGVRTVVAIEAFQSDQGLSVDGVASRALLVQLNQALARDSAQTGKRLSPQEQQSINAACPASQYARGSASYNRCVSSQLASLSSARPQSNVSSLSEDERRSREAACSSTTLTYDAYNRCLSNRSAPLSSASPSGPIEPRKVREESRDAGNYQTCIAGDYPALCKHSLLTSEEAVKVAAAERRVNYQTCIAGDYPALCKHSLLTSEEAMKVAAAERRVNYQTCIAGDYPALCKHSLLTNEEAMKVAAAERRVNYRTCISGDYPALCKHSLLTSEEAARVSAAERRAR